MNDSRRKIPSVDSLLGREEFAAILDARPRWLVVDAVRRALQRLRADLAAGRRPDAPTAAEVAAATRTEIEAMERPSLRRVINATGIPLHTNLGRAPLPARARWALEDAALGYSNLEYDLEAGARGSRYDHCADLLKELTGAEDALVVNNNAAAVVLVLNELARERGVIVSRGELVEIGGSFRVPDIIAKSGARIVEVGATNRTHPEDYERAIGPDTGALLKVHRSNFRQSGFVAEVSIGQLVALARKHEVPVIHDIGSGLLPDASKIPELPWEPSVSGSLSAGVDVVTFSGDKLLGGPQAGIIVGRGAIVAGLRANPLLRALRVDKLTLAALEATLRLWRDPATAATEVPALAMITQSGDASRRRAENIASALRERVRDAEIVLVRDAAEVGGGSYPGVQLETWTLKIRLPGTGESQLEARCRAATPPVIARVSDGALCVDPRTVLPHEEPELIDVLSNALTADDDPRRP
ncbi:MAG: L-seryl-tRNA(Sec) selenium transferase [Gemmatimonadetes bacterium]|uniref:L-seryl-tRNA(Sec) selenium transferase n=1 Tax=Candidatus Kutchimonas denitrificans TaxID=3056748 RepID=A0AAE5CCV0_9BACT|nr:L-seryl-tRNA(Sec) selenium transferase [Gemmatimonadota bacterium]NIR76170.1 L-seryl-tRNA(Sec) selenium transferase [Candidatus Kutchimonas denitrificans]NIS00610.1 L-seryl-tRNA(Sec) selenium transferase [Gemmatimonadota bacterium]NIT66755.1 L-seryl-tRNA(Sec) selenium transferase [Gemmatimonadota bacterium]NIV23354.1 L-seryl-tRNA(Sec) selenium transferase [Gemmatimonadota bacterium]